MVVNLLGFLLIPKMLIPRIAIFKAIHLDMPHPRIAVLRLSWLISSGTHE